MKTSLKFVLDSAKLIEDKSFENFTKMYKCTTYDSDGNTSCNPFYIRESKNSNGRYVYTIGQFENNVFKSCGFSFDDRNCVGNRGFFGNKKEIIIDIPIDYYEVIDRYPKNDIALCKTSDGINQYEFAVKIEEYEDYYGIDYTIGKFDGQTFTDTSDFCFNNWEVAKTRSKDDSQCFFKE